MKLVGNCLIPTVNQSSNSTAFLDLAGELISVLRNHLTKFILINQYKLVFVLNSEFSDVEKTEILLETLSFNELCRVRIFLIDVFVNYAYDFIFFLLQNFTILLVPYNLCFPIVFRFD